MKSIVLLLLMMVSLGCATAITYDQAYLRAKEHENILGVGWQDKHPVFFECALSKIADLKNACPSSSGIEGIEILVLEFKEGGTISNTFYEGKDAQLQCLAKVSIGVTCGNPPLPNLFVTVETHVQH